MGRREVLKLHLQRVDVFVVEILDDEHFVARGIYGANQLVGTTVP